MRLGEVLSMAGRSNEAVPSVNEAMHVYECKGNLVSARGARAFLTKLGG